MEETEREIKKKCICFISCLFYELLHEKIFVFLLVFIFKIGVCIVRFIR